jgi:UDP-glucose 4-epimerase
MRVLITGGLGFVGGRLGSYLSDSGFDVILGTRKKKDESLEKLKLPPVSVLQMEWDKISSLKSACEGVDIIVHAAGMNAADCTSNSTEALKVNGLATSNLLDSAISSGVERFLYISTGHVYKSPLSGNVIETNKLENIHPYASSHRAGEDVVRYAHQQQLITGIVTRLSNGYGAPIHKKVDCWMLLVNDLCRQAVETGEMVLKSSGVQRRDFIPMTSVIKVLGNLLIIEKHSIGNGVFNVGSGNSMSVWEMACLVQKRCEKFLNQQILLTRTATPLDSMGLEYSVKKLMDAGIKFEVDHNKEIDELVSFCLNEFK